MDMIFCDTSVNFNVPGQRKAPSTELLATVWIQSLPVPTGTLKKYAIEWTDPSGTLAPPSVPVNTWVQAEKVLYTRHTGRKIMSRYLPPLKTTRAGDAVFSKFMASCVWSMVVHIVIQDFFVSRPCCDDSKRTKGTGLQAGIARRIAKCR